VAIGQENVGGMYFFPSVGAALGVTIYWPVVCLAAVVAARDAPGWNLVNETPYWIVLPLITLWGAWGLWRLTRP